MFDKKLIGSLASYNPLQNGANLQYMTRRRFLAGVAATAAVGACGPAERQRELALLTWDAYADPRLLDLWREKTGGSIRYEIHISDPTSVNRLRAGETSVWDFVNLNNPWARKQLWPEGLIHDLPRERFEPLYEQMFE